MKLGYVTGGFVSWSFREKAEFAKTLGLQSLNMDFNEVQGHQQKDGVDMKAVLNDNGLIVGTLNSPIQLVQPELKAETLEISRRAAAVALSVDCKMLLTMAILPKGVDIPEPDLWKYMGEITREASEVCMQEGVFLAIETDPPASVQNLERMERLLKLVDHENLYINFDPTNYYLCGSDPLQVIERLGHRMLAVHIKDGVYKPDTDVEGGWFSPKHEVPIGEGELDYPAILSALDNRGLDLPAHIEHVGWPEQVINATNFINGVLKGMAQ